MDGKWATPRIAKLAVLVQKACLLREQQDILSRLAQAKSLLEAQMRQVKKNG